MDEDVCVFGEIRFWCDECRAVPYYSTLCRQEQLSHDFRIIKLTIVFPVS